jgi:hypothetical protein
MGLGEVTDNGDQKSYKSPVSATTAGFITKNIT